MCETLSLARIEGPGGANGISWSLRLLAALSNLSLRSSRGARAASGGELRSSSMSSRFAEGFRSLLAGLLLDVLPACRRPGNSTGFA
jgi:hypothetical protein